MSRKTKYNPERRAWKGKSYKKGATRVTTLRDQAATASDSPPPVLHYWGWTPSGQGNRCGATSGPSTSCAQSTTCPACLDALAEQLAGAIKR